MLADAAATALFAFGALAAVLAEAGATALLARVAPTAVLAYAGAAALLAELAPFAVLADAAAMALLAHVAPFAVLAQAAAAALLAELEPAPVLADARRHAECWSTLGLQADLVLCGDENLITILITMCTFAESLWFHRVAWRGFCLLRAGALSHRSNFGGNFVLISRFIIKISPSVCVRKCCQFCFVAFQCTDDMN